tara:strand:+ start:3851 stop:4276 length:426 start_codon:yes stop_codon:yes gene_type:complete
MSVHGQASYISWGFNTPFDPLLRVVLSTPQNADVSSLQNHDGTGLFTNVCPNVLPLFSFEQTLVDFDFYEVTRLELLPNFVEDGFTQPCLTDAHARTEFPRGGLSHDATRNLRQFTASQVGVGGASDRLRIGERFRMSSMF